MRAKLSHNTQNTVENFDSLPGDAHVNLGALQVLLCKSRPTIYRWIKAGYLPQPARTPGGQNIWTAGVIRKTLQAMSGGGM